MSGLTLVDINKSITAQVRQIATKACNCIYTCTFLYCLNAESSRCKVTIIRNMVDLITLGLEILLVGKRIIDQYLCTSRTDWNDRLWIWWNKSLNVIDYCVGLSPPSYQRDHGHASDCTLVHIAVRSIFQLCPHPLYMGRSTLHTTWCLEAFPESTTRGLVVLDLRKGGFPCASSWAVYCNMLWLEATSAPILTLRVNASPVGQKD